MTTWQKTRRAWHGGRMPQRFRKRSRSPMAWARPGPVALTEMTLLNPQSESIILRGNQVLALPSLALDRSRWVKLVRVICRLILIVTGAGNAGAYRAWYGWRIGDLTSAGAIASAVDVRLSADSDKREDWLYRKEVAFNVEAADASKVLNLGDSSDGMIFFDFKPNRKLQFEQALILSYGITVIAGGGGGSSVVHSATPEILLSGVN